MNDPYDRQDYQHGREYNKYNNNRRCVVGIKLLPNANDRGASGRVCQSSFSAAASVTEKHNAYVFEEAPDIIPGSSEDMYTEDNLPRDWVNCAAQELLQNAYGKSWRTRTSAEIKQCIRTTECMLMAISAHEKEKAKRKPTIWMPGMARA